MKIKVVSLMAIVSIMIFQSGNTFGNVQYLRLSYRDDPSTTVVIGWSNSGTSTNATVYYGTTDQGTDYSLYPSFHGVDTITNYHSLVNNFSRLTGLTPNTVYYFIVKDDQGVSSRYSFKTITDNPNDCLKFISGGDSRTGVPFVEASDCRQRRQSGNMLVAKIRPDFIAFTGDCIEGDLLYNVDQNWSDWMQDWQLTFGPDGRIAPVCACFGNHEVTDDFHYLFDMTNSDNHYALSFGGTLLRLYTLKSDENVSACDNTAQLSWFTDDLQAHTGNANEPFWKFVQYHIPMVPHGYYSVNQPEIDCWANNFQPYKIRLAMEGHTHLCKYTWPLVPSTAAGSENGFIKDTTNGTVFIGEGGWGAPLRTCYAPYSWTRDEGSFDAYQVIFVSKYRTEVRTAQFVNVSTVGQLSDADSACSLPSGITLWTPANGSTIVLTNPDASAIETYQNVLRTSSVYPNPAKSAINIDFDNSVTDKKATVSIFNGMAKLVRSIDINDLSKTTKINVAGLKNGTYFIYIKYGAKNECHKVIISH